MTRIPIIIGNWKMHGSKQQVERFFAEIGDAFQKTNLSAESAICPPFIYLAQANSLQRQTSNVKLGAQDVSAFDQGAYTGQIAASMLKEHGCHYVIVGHSERRQYCHESDDDIADKFFAAKAAGLVPILCVGESKEQREKELTNSVVLSQLQTILARQGIQAFQDTILAYEPIWAIGSGLTATPEQAQAVHDLLRKSLAEYDATLAKALPILYGGSVKPGNLQSLLVMPDIDGALVGGASLEAKDFLAMVETASAMPINS